MEESLKVTIQQLQAKVSHMNTIANPVFVENLEKKLNTSRSEIKKLRFAELRSYITDKNIQVENLSKKLYWAFELANKYIKNDSEDEENTLERDVLKHQTESVLQSLKALYNTFYAKKKKEFKEKQIPLACLPSFAQWSSDFERKECDEENHEDEEDFIIKKEESSKFEKEASELEKLLSDVTVEEAFANIKKHDADCSVHQLSSESPSKVDADKTSKIFEDKKKEKKKTPLATKKGKRLLKTQNKHLSPSPKKVSPSPKKADNSKSGDDINGSKIESAIKLESNCVLFKNLMDKSFQTPSKLVSSPQTKSVRKHSKTPEFKKSIILGDLHLSDSSFISDSSDSDMDDISLSKVKASLSLKKEKSNEKLAIPLDNKLPLSRKRKRSYNNNSSGNINTAHDGDDEAAKRMKDLEVIRQIISEMTGVPPLNHFAYSEDTDSSPDIESNIKSIITSKESTKNITPPNSPVFNVKNESINPKLDSKEKSTIPHIDHRVKPVKKLPVRKLNLQKRKLPSMENEDKSFVPQRVTRSSYKRQKQDTCVSAKIEHQEEDKTIKESLPQKIEGTVLLSVNESTKESHFISPSPIQPKTRRRNNSKNSQKLLTEVSSKEHTTKSSPSPDVTYNDITLDLNLSISSSNTDTEESEIDKLVERMSEPSINYNQDISTCEYDSSTTSTTSQNSFIKIDGKSEVNDFYEKTNLVPSENENHEDNLSAQKIEHFLPDQFIEENSGDVDMEERKIKERNNKSDENCSLIMSEILNEKDTTLISPISSPVKKSDFKFNQKNTEGELSQEEINCVKLEYQTSLEKNSNVTTVKSDMNNENTVFEKVSSPKVTDYNFVNKILSVKAADGIEKAPVLDPHEKVSSKVLEDHNSSSTIKVADGIDDAPVLDPHEKVSSKVLEDHNSSSTILTKVADRIEEALVSESLEKVSFKIDEFDNINSTINVTKVADGIEEAPVSEPEGKFSPKVEDHNFNSITLAAKITDEIENAAACELQEKVFCEVNGDHNSNSTKLSANVAARIEEAPFSELNLCKDKSEEKTWTTNVNKRNLFSDDLDEPCTSSLDIVSSTRTISESSAESLVLSCSSPDNKDLDEISENNSPNKTISKDSIMYQSSEENESSLVMDIDDVESVENNSDRLEFSDEEKDSDSETEKQNVELKLLESKIDSKNNFSKNTSSVQETEPLSFSFYQERHNTPEQADFQIPNIIFGENSTAEEEKIKTISKDSPEKYPPVNLPLIKSHPEFQEATFKLEDSYMNSKNLQEYFQDILGCLIGGPGWDRLIESIITFISDIKSPNVLDKFQPIVRNILVSVLRASPCEKRDPKFSLPPTIYKLFHIVRILEKHFKLPVFALDSLVNVAAHKLILTKKLRPNSLSSLTTWVMSSCHAQYNKLESPANEESLRWGRCFLTDLLFHHKGFVHDSLLSALYSSRRIFIRIVKYRESTNLEKLIYWIAYHGNWEGPKITRSNLIQDLNMKLWLRKPPHVNATDIIKAILLVLINKEADKNELSSCKAAFLLYLKWVPLRTIINSLFPMLKNVYYEDLILNKPSLDDNPLSS
ncbi:hypothetical protein Avbf_03254 [Armadillidium vulgare]|nr:hypothetical protein Avbf_03254 [Armadillidium vulgare]